MGMERQGQKRKQGKRKMKLMGKLVKKPGLGVTQAKPHCT
jgi:hypothetical protein